MVYQAPLASLDLLDSPDHAVYLWVTVSGVCYLCLLCFCLHRYYVLSCILAKKWRVVIRNEKWVKRKTSPCVCFSMDQMPWVLDLKTWTAILCSSGYEKDCLDRCKIITFNYGNGKKIKHLPSGFSWPTRASRTSWSPCTPPVFISHHWRTLFWACWTTWCTWQRWHQRWTRNTSKLTLTLVKKKKKKRKDNFVVKIHSWDVQIYLNGMFRYATVLTPCTMLWKSTCLCSDFLLIFVIFLCFRLSNK